MKSIYNPTESEVKITILGKEYSVEAGQSTEETDVIAEKWVATHGFLQIKELSSTPKVEKKEEKKEDEVEEIPEEAIEEVKEVIKESFIKKATKKVASKK